jgi:hypothetical protein
MQNGTRLSAGTSRRALVAAGAGWVLGAGGLLLPASLDEAEARGSLGGAMGGRHGKDHRGRSKHRKNNKNDNDGQARDQGLFSKDCSVAFLNQTGTTFQVNIQLDSGYWSCDTSGCLSCGPGFNSPIYADGSVTFNINANEWGAHDGVSYDDTWVGITASNPDVGEPKMTIGPLTEYYGVDLSQSESLAVGEGFQYRWASPNGTFYLERLADTSDYKMFRVTAQPSD